MKYDSSMMYGTGNAWKKFYAAKKRDELHGMLIVVSGILILAGYIVISLMGV